MNQTFQNSAQVLSVGIFFTLMIVGLSANLPHALASGLQAHGVSAQAAHGASQIPPVSILFAAFLGYNPIEHLIGAHALGGLSAVNHAAVTGRSFFPHLISSPFSSGLHEAFLFAIVACLIAAAASLARGGKYRHGEQPDGGDGGARAGNSQAADADGKRATDTSDEPAPDGENDREGPGGRRRRLRDPIGSYVRSITRKEEQHAR